MRMLPAEGAQVQQLTSEAEKSEVKQRFSIVLGMLQFCRLDLGRGGALGPQPAPAGLMDLEYDWGEEEEDGGDGGMDLGDVEMVDGDMLQALMMGNLNPPP